MTLPPDDLPCQELVELVTDYLEGRLPEYERRRFDAHLQGCSGCRNYLEHMRLMMDIMLLALWSDTTRVGTMMTADAQTNEDYSFVSGVKGGFHSISHHAEEPVRKAQYEACVTWHVAVTADTSSKFLPWWPSTTARRISATRSSSPAPSPRSSGSRRASASLSSGSVGCASGRAC